MSKMQRQVFYSYTEKPIHGPTIFKEATELAILDKAQNNYIFLENLSHYFDTYLTHKSHTKPLGDELLIKQCIASSTRYGTE